MKKNHFFCIVLSVVISLLCNNVLYAQVTEIDINGTLKPCKKTRGIFFIDTPTIGIAYKWSISDSTLLLSNVYGDSTSILFDGIDSVVIIFVEGRDSTGTLVAMGSKAVSVKALPNPTITSSVRVGCEKLNDSIRAEDPSEGLFLDDGSCFKVCEYSLTSFQVSGNSGSSFVWTVTGGTFYGSSTGSSVQVNWGGIGSATLSVTETTIDGCKATQTICIEVIAKPTVWFGAMPDINQSEITVCLNQAINFVSFADAGKGSPIENWYWDFGDGTTYSSSTHADPTHSYSVPGRYEVTLTVKNSCNCTESYSMIVNVLEEEGVVIECPSVVCEGDVATYSIADLECGEMGSWDVIGGSFTPNGASVEVTWDNVDDDGFGYVTFDATNCSNIRCPGITTVKIPVVKKEGVIKGDAVICIGQQQIYRLPAWSGTTFNWTVTGSISGNMTALLTDQPNEVVITSSIAQTITIYCEYNTLITDCSGEARLTVEVMNPAILTGDTEKCAGDTATVTLSNYSGAFTWIVKKPNGTVQYISSTGNNPLNIPNLLAGTYTINVLPAGNGFCPPEPFILKVTAAPTAPNNITVPAEICPNVPYEFTVGSTMANHEFVWEISQGTGTIQGSNMGSKIAVVFTGTGPWELSVKRVNMHNPSCPSVAITKTIHKAIPTTNISGSHTPCPNNTYGYQVDYTNGETYEWSITPQTAGSVTTGNSTQTVNILWNNTTAPIEAFITIKITKCGIITTDTFQVHIAGVPNFSLPNITVCRGEEFTLPLSSTPAITPGSANVTWNFGDGIIEAGTDVGVLHAYTALNQSVMNYAIAATITGYNGCMVTPVTVTNTVTVNPSPVINISPAGYMRYCDTFAAFNITASLQAGYGNTTQLTWYTPTGSNSCNAPFTTCNPILSNNAGKYYAVATNDYNCHATSDSLIIYKQCLDTCQLNESLGITINSVSCGQINVQGSYTGSPVGYNWQILPAYANYTIISKTLNNFQVKFDNPGIYTVRYLMEYMTQKNGQDTVCTIYHNIPVPVPLIQELQVATDCGTGSNYNVTIHDKSRYLPGTVFNSYTFRVYDAAGTTLLQSQTVTHPVNYHSFVVAAGNSYRLEMTVNYTYNQNGVNITESCTTIQHTINLPAKPVADFSFEAGTPATPCEGINVQFVNNSTPATGLSYHWDFGDAAEVLVKTPGRVYQYDINKPTPNIVLTVTNEHGCADTTQQNITIVPNELGGTLSPSAAVICEGTSQTLQYVPDLGSPNPLWYHWKNDLTPLYTSVHPQNSASVSNTGYYWVRVEDANKCYFNTPAVGVAVVKLQQPVITGAAFACENQPFTLMSSYVGDPQDIDYIWYRDGQPVTNPNGNSYIYTEQDPLTPNTTYHYEVEVRIYNTSVSGYYCYQKSSVFQVTVNAPPATPVITATIKDCDTYTLALSATASGSGVYNWSNGMYGSNINVNNGGYYKVWFTAGSTGCTSSAEIQIDKDPKGYLWIVPTGCYEYCWKEYAITYTGTTPIIPFAYWQWNMNTIPYINDNNSIPEPLTFALPGSYSLLLENEFGCTAESGNVNMRLGKECPPIETHCDIDPYLYIVSYEPTAEGWCIVHLELNVSNNNGISVPYTLTPDVGNPPIPAGGILQSGGNIIPITYTSQDFSGGVTFILKIWLPEEGGEECIFEIPIEFDCGQAKSSITNSGKPFVPAKPALYSIQVYPNPAQGEARIAYSYPQQTGKVGSIELYNSIGIRVAAYTLPSAAKGTMPLSLGNLPSGVYLVVLKENGVIKANSKLVIVK